MLIVTPSGLRACPSQGQRTRVTDMHMYELMALYTIPLNYFWFHLQGIAQL